MKSLSDSVNWYGRTFPRLERDAEARVCEGEDAANELVRHAVYHVVRGLVMRRKKMTKDNLATIIGEMVGSAEEWMKTDRAMPSHEYMLEDIASRFSKITGYDNLLDSGLFVSFDAPVPGGRESSHGEGPKTWGDIISSTVGGRAGSSLSHDRVGSATNDDLVYDPDLDAYVRSGHVKDRKKHVVIEREKVDAGIFSYANEVQRIDEKRLESLSPIRGSRIKDRIVAPTKAKLRKCRKTFRGQMWLPPKPGCSATGMPLARTEREDATATQADFRVNKARASRIPVKCLGCAFLSACSSWICGGFFCLGIHGPATCTGPFTGEDIKP